MKRRYVLKNKKRFIVTIMFLSLIIVFTGLMVNAGAASKTVNIRERVIVAQGDTLWGIALEHSRNKDIREYIYEIKKLNRLEGEYIYAGQVLYLP